jgi:hypothetical protein
MSRGVFVAVAPVAWLSCAVGCASLLGIEEPNVMGGDAGMGADQAANDVGAGDVGASDDSASDDAAGDADVGGESNETSCTPPAPPTLDDCTGIVSLPAPPVIDGVLDCGVPLWPMPLAGWTGKAPMPATVQAALGIAWRSDGLYFFVHVAGAGSQRYPAPTGSAGAWCGDAVELFADNDGTFRNPPLYDNPGTIQVIAEAPQTVTTAVDGYMYRNQQLLSRWSGQFIVLRTGDGFDAEAFLVASDLGLPSWGLTQGANVGLDVSVDLGDPSNQTAICPNLGQFTIQVLATDAGCGQAACNVAEFCRPRLGP